MDLPEGEHQYKFFVDGQWVHDPSEVTISAERSAFKQDDWLKYMFSLQPVVTSQLGTINNLIHVKKSDFEVFDALQVDSLECSDTSGKSVSHSYNIITQTPVRNNHSHGGLFQYIRSSKAS